MRGGDFVAEAVVDTGALGFIGAAGLTGGGVFTTDGGFIGAARFAGGEVFADTA